VYVCLLEAIDLSSTPVTRVLPPLRPPQVTVKQTSVKPSQSVTHHSSLASDQQPTSKSSALSYSQSYSQHSTMISNQQPSFKPTILPSLIEQATLKSFVPPAVSHPVFRAAAQFPGTADPHVSRGADQQLGMTEERIIGTAASVVIRQSSVAEQKCTGPTSVVEHIVLPVVISTSVAGAAHVAGSHGPSLLDKLSTKHTFTDDKLSHETKTDEICVPDDLSTDKTRQRTIEPDNLSVEMRNEREFIGDNLSTKQIDAVAVEDKSKERSSVLDDVFTETQREQTFVSDTRQTFQSDIMSAVTKTQPKMSSAELVLKPEVTRGGTDQPANTATSASITSE